MTYSAIDIANYFVRKGLEEPSSYVSPMKLQKLVYIAHGYHLAIFDEPLISDDVGAWPFGPVIGSIYKSFLKFSKNPITELAQNPDGEIKYIEQESSNLNKLLELVWDKYRSLSPTELSNLTHQNGTPWNLTYSEGQSKVIPEELIKKHYKKLLSEAS